MSDMNVFPLSPKLVLGRTFPISRADLSALGRAVRLPLTISSAENRMGGGSGT
jgi:hypothetical protein